MLFSKWEYLFNSHYLCTSLNYQEVVTFIQHLSLKRSVLCGHTDNGLNKSQTNTIFCLTGIF